MKLDVGAEVEVRRENSTLSNFFKGFFQFGQSSKVGTCEECAEARRCQKSLAQVKLKLVELV